MTMRRKEREIQDIKQIQSILAQADVIRLGLIDGNLPYIVPLNFGWKLTLENKFQFFFHSAPAGKKIMLLEQNNRASFEIDILHHFTGMEKPIPCQWSVAYESIMGQGTVHFLTTMEEKERALTCIVSRYAKTQPLEPFSLAVIEQTAVFCLDVEYLSQKAASTKQLSHRKTIDHRQKAMKTIRIAKVCSRLLN